MLLLLFRSLGFGQPGLATVSVATAGATVSVARTGATLTVARISGDATLAINGEDL